MPRDIRVWREALTARGAGYSVAVIAPRSSSYPKRYEVIDGIEIYRHPCPGSSGGKLGQLAEYGAALLWETLLSLKLFFKNRFDIIHGANPPDHIFLIALLFRPFGVKYIFDHHDLAPELYVCKYNGKKNAAYRLLSAMERLSCRAADAVISTNRSYKAHVMERHGVPPEKIFIVRNDPEQPAPRALPLGRFLNGRPTRLVYVGSINRQDGVDAVMRTVHILMNDLGKRRIHCTVVGDGDDLPRVKGLCAQLGVAPQVTFTGYVNSRAAVKAIIEDADICLETAPHSEVNCKSTFIKVMEYMSAGKPIVAFDLEETRYSAQGAALLVEQGNLRAFAEATARLIDDPELRARLGADGKRRIATELNWDKAARELLRAYDYVSTR